MFSQSVRADGEAPRRCSCDVPAVVCVDPLSALRLVWEVRDPASWPRAAGVVGTCTIDDVVRPVVVVFFGEAPRGYPAWLDGEEIVVPAPYGREVHTWIRLPRRGTRTSDTPRPDEPLRVTCLATRKEVLVLFQGGPVEAVTGATCASRKGEPVRFRTVPYLSLGGRRRAPAPVGGEP